MRGRCQTKFFSPLCLWLARERSKRRLEGAEKRSHRWKFTFSALTFLKRIALAAVVLDDTALVGEQPAWEITIQRSTRAEAILGTWMAMAKLQSHRERRKNYFTEIGWHGGGGALWHCIQAIEHWLLHQLLLSCAYASDCDGAGKNGVSVCNCCSTRLFSELHIFWVRRRCKYCSLHLNEEDWQKRLKWRNCNKSLFYERRNGVETKLERRNFEAIRSPQSSYKKALARLKYMHTKHSQCGGIWCCMYGIPTKFQIDIFKVMIFFLSYEKFCPV